MVDDAPPEVEKTTSLPALDQAARPRRRPFEAIGVDRDARLSAEALAP